MHMHHPSSSTPDDKLKKKLKVMLEKKDIDKLNDEMDKIRRDRKFNLNLSIRNFRRVDFQKMEVRSVTLGHTHTQNTKRDRKKRKEETHISIPREREMCSIPSVTSLAHFHVGFSCTLVRSLLGTSIIQKSIITYYFPKRLYTFPCRDPIFVAKTSNLNVSAFCGYYR